jgi:ribose transport system substrate-binding protein
MLTTLGSSKLRKTAALIGTGALVIGLAACSGDNGGGGGEGGEERVRIGFSAYGTDVFVAQGQEGMEAYAEANNIELLWNSADGDVATQGDQIEKFINAGVDGILIAPVAYDSLAPQLERAKEAGIAVGLVNATVKDDSAVDVAVLPDNIAAGKQGAQMMVDHLGGKGKVAILQCVLGASFEVLRTQGMEEVLAEYPDMEVVAKDGALSADQALDKVRNWLTANPDIQGIIGCGDEIGLGAYEATQEAGMNIPITGVDGTEDGLNAVKDGKFIGTQMQHARTEFAAGLAALYGVVKGDDMESLYTYTMAPVTAENVEEFFPNVVTDVDAFLAVLPAIVDRNLETGLIEDESTP